MQCRTPAPIFNPRRRQLQAVYADINPKTDLMPVGGFSNSSTSSSKCSLNTNQNYFPGYGQNYNRGNLNQSNVRNGAGFSASNANTNSTVTYNSNGTVIRPPSNRNNVYKPDGITMNKYFNQTNIINRGSFNQPITSHGKNFDQEKVGNFNTIFRSKEQDSSLFIRSNDQSLPSPKEKYRRSGSKFSLNKPISGFQTNNGPPKVNHYDGRCQQKLDYIQQYQQPSSTAMSSTSSGSLFHSAGGVPIAAPKGPAPGTKPPPSMFQSDNLCKKAKFDSASETSYLSVMRNCNTGTITTLSANSIGQTQIKPTQKFDKTMKFITTSITGIKQWNKFDSSSSTCPMMFEVFGLVDSAALKSNDGIAKDFTLKDGTSTLQCVFHEIDRILPRLVRGQWHRCVGNIEYKSGKMKCVVIRPANNDEIKTSKVVASIAEKFLEKYDTSINEQ